MAAPVSPDALARLLLQDPVPRFPVITPPPPLTGSSASHRRTSGPLDDDPKDDRAIDAFAIIVDIRGRDAYRRSHIRGSISIPRERLPASLFLLPPRERWLLMVGRNGMAAAEGARFLAGRGRSLVTWLDGSPRALPENLMRTGGQIHRAWKPAPLLRDFIDRLPRTGEAIDLACGSGRQTAFLALHRSRVLGIDILPDALVQARSLARAAAVPRGRITFRRIDLTDLRAVGVLLPPRRYQVILCFRYLDRALLPVIAKALAPDGWVIYQTFLEAQSRTGRRPTQSRFLLKPGELRAAFESVSGIEIIHYVEGPDDKGDHLASLVAKASGLDATRPTHADPQAT